MAVIVWYLDLQLQAISAYHTKVVSSNPADGEVHSVQYCVMKFDSDLRQVCGFLRVRWFSPPIKLTAILCDKTSKQFLK